MPSRFEVSADGFTPAALPDNGIVQWGTIIRIKDDDGFTLIGDAQAQQIVEPIRVSIQQCTDCRNCVPVDFFRIMLNPARSGIDLLMRRSR